MIASEPDWQRLQRVLILLLLLSLGLYLPSLFHDVFADDEIYLAFTNRVLREANWADLYLLLLRPANPWEFLPLRDFTYWLDFYFYGDEPSGFHATNLVWYAASSLASFCLFRELILFCRPLWAARATVLSLCGMLIFVAHPAHVEVAVWIASRKDLIAGTLAFFSLATLVRAIRRDWPCREILLAAFLMFAACFGKAAAMTNILCVTALIGAGWATSPQLSRVKRISYLALFLVVVAVAFLIHLRVGESTGIRIENHPGLFLILDRASRIFATLIGILLLPYPLRFYYDVYQIGDWHWLVSAVAVLLLLGSFRELLQRRSLWAVGIVLALSPLLIYLQLMPFTTWSMASERFVFVSVAGVALVLVDLFGRMGSPKAIGAALLLIVLPCALVVWSRIDEWGSRKTLLDREYELQPAFHNAIRDRIGFTLLPEKRYAEAAVLARQVSRSYAAEALLALVDAEHAYRKMSDAQQCVASEQDAWTLRRNYCAAVAKLQSANYNGYAHIPVEPDVSYNNILRSLDRQLKYHFADTRILCGQ